MLHFRMPGSNPSQPQDPNRPPPGAVVPPNASGTDMTGASGGPSTPLQQGNSSDSNLNAPKFTG